ncbi:HupE/UreJ family protein [Marinobacterium sedimentorum]|uniref:HupE/UreJ family protein n=1 Tax=Marinobacterium sedimentorum TaxID=2927804 RepID=UPI0020C64DED|nr:HupE/UreJ family protein [Marinobacterium sedimentorum]MCP8687102.1 HupE/UreJ family protein [Marinobacterium sedimentorum]
MKTTHKAALASLLAVASPLTLAHTGQDLGGFAAGMLHPLTGLDHLAMLLGVGALGAGQTLKARTGIYAAALVALFGGALLGLTTGWAGGIELMIGLSLFVVAAGLWFGRGKAMAMMASVVLVLFHGWAHGLEVAPAQVAFFLPGMLLTACALLGAGFALGRQLAPRQLGASSALAAVALALLG